MYYKKCIIYLFIKVVCNVNYTINYTINTTHTYTYYDESFVLLTIFVIDISLAICSAFFFIL
jgi:hypothetical protein